MRQPSKTKSRNKRDTAAIAQRFRETIEEMYGALDDAGRAAIARQHNYKERTFQAHLKGKSIGIDTLIVYARDFGVNLGYLLTGQNPEGKLVSPRVPPPPLAYRRVPLLTSSAIAGARSKEDILALDLPRTVLVSMEEGLGKDVFAYEAPDAAMVAPVFDPQSCIRKGEQAIIDAGAPPVPGTTVCAVLFNPIRIQLRIYGVWQPTPDDPPAIRLVPLSPLFGPELIRSPADGFLLGQVDRVQSVRRF